MLPNLELILAIESSCDDTAAAVLSGRKVLSNCIANQFAKSDLAHYNVNEVRFNQMFMSEGMKLDTTSLSQHIKIFEEKVGANQPMRFDVRFKDF